MYGAQDDLDGLDLNQFEYEDRRKANRKPVVNHYDDNVFLQSNALYENRYLNQGYKNPTGLNRQTSFMSNASRRDRRSDPNYDYRRNVTSRYNPRDEVYEQDRPASRYYQEESEPNLYYPQENSRSGYEDYQRSSFHPEDDHRRRFEDHHRSWDPARDHEDYQPRSRYDTSVDHFRKNGEHQNFPVSTRLRASKKKKNTPKNSHEPVKKTLSALEQMPYIPPPDYEGAHKLSYVPKPDYH